MEDELGAPRFRAVIVKKTANECQVDLLVRYHRKSVFAPKRKTFKVSVPRGADAQSSSYERYLAATKLKPGDEIFVDPYGEDWCEPMYYDALRRRWNLRFA